MINPALDLPALTAAFRRRRRLQVGDILIPEAAEAIHDCLTREVPWNLACHFDGVDQLLPPGQLAALPPDGPARLGSRILEAARSGFAFAFMSFPMVDAYRRGSHPGLLLNRVVEEIASPEFVRFATTLTCDPGIRRVDAQATRYDPGHFLNVHDDFGKEGKERRFAYVLNFSRDWRAEWGGLLQFLDDDGSVAETFVPRFNSLSIFAVPTPHIVSYVAPFAGGPRLSITGWFTG